MSNNKQILGKTQILDINPGKASRDSRLEWLEETGKLVLPDTSACGDLPCHLDGNSHLVSEESKSYPSHHSGPSECQFSSYLSSFITFFN